jgi:hypothetical protein
MKKNVSPALMVVFAVVEG